VAVGLIVSGAGCLSASAVFVKLADVNPGTAAFLRCAVALVVLVPMLMLENRRRGAMPWRLQRDAAIAGVFLGADYVMWTVSILDVGAAIATVLINVQVIVFPLLTRVLDGTRIPRRFLYACPVMLVGIAMAGGIGAGAAHPVRGTLLGIGAGSAYAVYLYLTRSCGRRSPRHVVSPVCTSTAAAAVTAGVISLLATGLPLGIPGRSWGWIIALALLGQVAAWLLIGKGSPRVAPNASAALLLLQPLIALGLAFAVLRETPTPIQLCGCALVIGAVWIGNRIPRRASPADPSQALALRER
jgi:drug/metabolite transporter (DMT)-like permease